jgi:hypothetical protein
VGTVAAGYVISRSRNNTRRARGKKNRNRRDIFRLDPGHAKRCFGDENISCPFLIQPETGR